MVKTPWLAKQIAALGALACAFVEQQKETNKMANRVSVFMKIEGVIQMGECEIAEAQLHDLALYTTAPTEGISENLSKFKMLSN